MVEAINTDHEQFTFLWWCIGVSVLGVAFLATSLIYFKRGKENLSVGLAVTGLFVLIVSLFMWLPGYVGNHSGGEYSKYTVTGEIVALAGNIAVVDGVDSPLDLGDSSDLAEVGDVISAECKDIYGEFRCYEVGLVK